MRLTLRLLALIVVLAAVPARAAQPSSYILVDVGNGTVLDARDANHRWQPASLTKLMTAYLTFKALQDGRLTPTSPVRISAKAARQAPAKMGYKPGTIVNVDNALKMLLVKSANDIAMALAETVGGSEAGFVAMMNAEAHRLGMVSTHYDNPNGLPDTGQIVTARDLAVLARALWLDFPQYRGLFGIPAIRAGKRVLPSENVLLERYHGANGMKTGFVCAAGYNIVGMANRNGRQLLVVVLGASSPKTRAETAALLLNRGFANTYVGAGHPLLARYDDTPSLTPLADLHDEVCRPGGVPEDMDPLLVNAGQVSALDPPFPVMAPVPVYTGRADVAANPAVKAPPARARAPQVPLPRLRPAMAAGGASQAYAEVPAPSPAAIAIKPPLDLTQMH